MTRPRILLVPGFRVLVRTPDGKGVRMVWWSAKTP